MNHPEPDPNRPVERGQRIPCAGGIVLDGAGRLLLIKRANPPAAGSWSVPGGRCEPGETTAEACVREVAEETGLAVEVLRLAGTVERAAPGEDVYVIDDFVCSPVIREQDPGTPRAGELHPGELHPGELHPRELRSGELCAVQLRAGDDAAEARWVSRADLGTLVLAPGLFEALEGWGLLPS